MRVAAFAATIAFGLLLLAGGNVHAEVTGTCTGGCGEAFSCCDCSKSLGGGPGCCLACGGPGLPPSGKACCYVGGGAGCTAPDGCCSDADCTGGQVCQTTVKSYPTCSCPSGQTLCGGKCTVTRTDPNNCGGCGKACTPGDTCCGGTCVSCPFNGECVGDQPKCDCPPKLPDKCVEAGIPGIPGTGFPICYNLKTGEPAGRCGSCAITCSADQKCCNGACINVNNDKANCGECGLQCATAPSGKPACCNGACKDLNHDTANCGTCGRGCGPAQRCINGACEGGPPCQGGRCDPSCTCPVPGQTCVRGFCSLPQ